MKRMAGAFPAFFRFKAMQARKGSGTGNLPSEGEIAPYGPPTRF